MLLDFGLDYPSLLLQRMRSKVGYAGRIVVVMYSFKGLKYSSRIYHAMAARVSHAIVGAEGERECTWPRGKRRSSSSALIAAFAHAQSMVVVQEATEVE
jgi:hypothetical protein